MTDTFLTMYAIVAVCSFFYALYDEAKHAEVGFLESSLRERVRRISMALFLGGIGYPLLVLVGCSFLGVIASLLYVSVTGIGRVIGVF